MMNEVINPKAISIEASSHCQLACPTCLTANGEIHKIHQPGFLKFKDFKSVIDQNPGLKAVELSNNGEMFLNPELLLIMEYAHQKSVKLTAANGTNFNYVSPEVMEGLVKYQFQAITVSLDGATEETYQMYRKKGSFSKIIDNIKELNKIKQRQQSIYPILVWQFIIFGHNEHEIKQAAKKALELRMRIVFKLQWDDQYSPIKNKEAVAKILGVSSRQEYLQKYGISYMQPACHQLWRMPFFNWDGKLLGCCKNWWSDFGGNLFKDGLQTAVNHDKIKYAREMLQGKVSAREDIPCLKCNVYQEMLKHQHWIKKEEIVFNESTVS